MNDRTVTVWLKLERGPAHRFGHGGEVPGTLDVVSFHVGREPRDHTRRGGMTGRVSLESIASVIGPMIEQALRESAE